MAAFLSRSWPLAVLLAILAIGLGALGKAWFEFLWLRQSGVTTQAEVVGRGQHGKGPYQLTYRYTIAAPGGTRTIEHTSDVSQEIYSSARQPGSIAIAYIPDRPEVTNIVGNRYALMGDIAWTTVILGSVEGFVAVLTYLHIADLAKGARRRARP